MDGEILLYLAAAFMMGIGIAKLYGTYVAPLTSTTRDDEIADRIASLEGKIGVLERLLNIDIDRDGKIGE